MASAEIITIGTELLLGQLVDTNTAAIAAGLAEIGIDVYRETSIGDNEGRIAQAVREALERADAVVCAGGLGPTVDDLTREAIAAATGCPLQLDEAVVVGLRERFRGYGRPMTENNLRQGMFPQGATVLDNPNGSAPGFALETGEKAVVVLPGPPRELQPMLRDHALPWLARKFGSRSVIVTRVLRTTGLAESELDARIQDLFRAGINPSIAVLARPGEVDVKLTAKAATREEALALIDILEPEIHHRLGNYIFSADGSSLPEALGSALRARRLSLATAESCTGGLIGSMITSVPRSSEYFAGGVIPYSDEAKTRLLHVAPELIERFGSVSAEVASAMATGVREAFRSSAAISVTGIAGPSGGSADKPVGLVYVAFVGLDGKAETHKMQLPGNREGVQRRAALSALSIALRAVTKGEMK